MNILNEERYEFISSKDVMLKGGVEAKVLAYYNNYGLSIEVRVGEEYAGGASFGENSYAGMPDTYSATNAHVNDEWQRKGVATIAYDYMEELGYTVVPEPRHYKRTDDANKFWANREKRGVTEAVEWAKRASRDEVVQIDVAKVEASFAKDREFYVGPNGEGGIKGRYERFGQWMEKGQAVEMAELCLNPYGEIAFINGRHRFAWMRDQGVKTLPVSVPADDAAAVKEKFGA